MAKPAHIPKTEIIYQEEDLYVIMAHFIKAYEAKIIDSEWFLDAAKDKVVFKLVVEK